MQSKVGHKVCMRWGIECDMQHGVGDQVRGGACSVGCDRIYEVWCDMGGGV